MSPSTSQDAHSILRDQARKILRLLPVEDRVIVSAYVEQEVRRRVRNNEQWRGIGWIAIGFVSTGILFGGSGLLIMSEQDDQTCREWTIQALGGTL